MQYRQNPQVFTQGNGQLLYFCLFWANLADFGLKNVFLKNQAVSLFSIPETLTSYKKSKKLITGSVKRFDTDEPIQIPEDPKYVQKE